MLMKPLAAFGNEYETVDGGHPSLPTNGVFKGPIIFEDSPGVVSLSEHNPNHQYPGEL